MLSSITTLIAALSIPVSVYILYSMVEVIAVTKLQCKIGILIDSSYASKLRHRSKFTIILLAISSALILATLGLNLCIFKNVLTGISQVVLLAGNATMIYNAKLRLGMLKHPNKDKH